ncbi:MAG: hypothetical protein H0T58_04540 [Gemmatimonadales bacterium]|nr:hypothetical protein [Gemmatimonadales bacterium]
MTERGRLRIGILQDSAFASWYIRDLITWAAQQDGLEVSHLMIYAPPEEPRFSRWRRKFLQHKIGGGLRIVALRAIQTVEQAFLRVYYGGKHRDHSGHFQVDHLVPNTLHIRPTISKSGLVYRFSGEEVAKVRAADCDVLIRGGRGILKGEILEASTFGVLSFHHGDNRVNRGGPAGFWETYLEWPATGFIIQRLTSELDGGDVLMRGSYSTKWFYLFNQAALENSSNVHLKDLLKKLAVTRKLPPAEAPAPYSSRLFRSPSILDCLLYTAKVIGRLVRKAVLAILPYKERWAVSYMFTGWKNAVLWRGKTPKPPAGRFVADPFLWQHEGKTFCLVEDYLFRKKIGRISAFQIDKQGATEPEVVLAEPFHLSFPFLFEFNGTIYMCPECCGSGQIRLYRAVEFPGKWEFVKTIMDHVAASDTMMFEKGGRWWMLTNLERAGRGDYRSELYLFSAESPLSDSWVSHPSNPVKIDPVGGRNAGLLRDGDRLYRAGQVQGFDQYGVGVRLFEICTLSPDEYRERMVAEIRPGFQDGLIGTHHISSTGFITVVDSYRREFVR